MRRPGFDAVPAVRNGQLHEIKSPLILQPGPAALTDGLDEAAGDHWRLYTTVNWCFRSVSRVARLRTERPPACRKPAALDLSACTENAPPNNIGRGKE